MSLLTTFYGLVKPLRTERPDITQINPNFDIIDAALRTNALGLAGKGPAVATTTVKTSAYTAVPNEAVICDPTGGGFTVTLPTAAQGAVASCFVAIRRNAVGGTNAVTIARGGSDTINGGTASLSLPLDSETVVLLRDQTNTAWWGMFGQKSLASLDARFASITATAGLVGCKATSTATTSIPTATTTAVPLAATSEWDTNGFHSTSTNNARITIPTGFAGKYHVHGVYSLAGSATGRRMARVQKNGGGTAVARGDFTPGTNANVLTVNAAGDVTLADGDYLELYAYQDSGGSLALATGTLVDSAGTAITASLSIRRLG